MAVGCFERHYDGVSALVKRLVEHLVGAFLALVSDGDPQKLAAKRVNPRESVVGLGYVHHAKRIAVVEHLAVPHLEGVRLAVLADAPAVQHLREYLVVRVSPE